MLAANHRLSVLNSLKLIKWCAGLYDTNILKYVKVSVIKSDLVFWRESADECFMIVFRERV